MASTPYQLMAPARLRAHPAGASKRQLQFDQLVPTPVAASSQQSAAEKKFDSESAAFLDDHQKIEALVRGIKSKLCGKGDAIDEWRFCGDESNARSLLDPLVEELTSRLTRFNNLFTHAFRLDDVTATVMPNANKLLKELLEYLCGGPALASVREAHRYFPDDGKVILTALVRDVMPDLEDFDKTDFIFTPTVEVPAGVNPKQFIKAFTDAVSNAATDLGQHSSLDISREDAVRLFLRRTCPVTYKQVHEDYAIEKVKTQAELTLGIRRKGKGKGKGKKGKGQKQKSRVTFHPGSKQFYGNCWSSGGRHRQADCTHMQHLAAHSMRLDPEALAEGAFTDVLAARYQAAYEHSEEAFQAVCWEHGTPDICDSSESVCTYPDDGSLSFAAYLTQGDEASYAPAWAPQEWTDSEWDAWELESYTQEQHEEWDRLQRKAAAKFQAFCYAGEEAGYDEQDLQEPYSFLSLGRVHFGSFGVGGVDRDTTPTPPVDARMDSAVAMTPIDLSPFYRADPSTTCSPCDPQPASTQSHLDAGVMLDGTAQTVDPTAPLSGDTPADAEHGDTCMHPVSALFAHETPLEPGSGLFADMVLAGNLRFQSMTEQHLSETREGLGAEVLELTAGVCGWTGARPFRGASAVPSLTGFKGAGVYATAMDLPASGHGVSAGSLVGASDEHGSPEPRGSGGGQYCDPPPPVTGPALRRGVVVLVIGNGQILGLDTLPLDLARETLTVTTASSPARTGSVLETTSHLADLMITVGGAVVHMSWWLGFTWTAHGTPPPGLVFTCSPVVSAYALSRDGDGIVVDSGATGNITGTRNRNTPVRVSPFVEFHAVMGHGSTASLLKLYDLPGIQLGRPLLSRRAIAAMPTCSQFCAVCCTSKLKQKPCGHHDQLRSVAIQPGQKWAADMTGPITPAGFNGHLYRCQFIDYVSSVNVKQLPAPGAGDESFVEGIDGRSITGGCTAPGCCQVLPDGGASPSEDEAGDSGGPSTNNSAGGGGPGCHGIGAM
ncbi:hypothetical protein CYMTET_5103 [Cymbomonas tetramitiformis]|uniref:Uncharacterized protein n=1 Tax=Cymbomonas tetramitiformis TaxID=36881 RepID=A0AAE0GZU6_9CHLO|nr:hypothetical protein CYMTET_5103 [Cymbomonas tetramitiformis]